MRQFGEKLDVQNEKGIVFSVASKSQGTIKRDIVCGGLVKDAW